MSSKSIKSSKEASCKRNIGFMEDNGNINPRYNCNRSKLHFSKRGTNLFIENILFSLSDEIISHDIKAQQVGNSSSKSKKKTNKNLPLSDDNISYYTNIKRYIL